MGFDEGGADEFAREVEGAEDGGEGGGEGEGGLGVMVDVEGVEGAVWGGGVVWGGLGGWGDLLMRLFLAINSVARALRRRSRTTSKHSVQHLKRDFALLSQIGGPPLSSVDVQVWMIKDNISPAP